MGVEHPVSWQHAYDGGRAWYTAMGHTACSYSERPFLDHLLGGIEWAAGVLYVEEKSAVKRSHAFAAFLSELSCIARLRRDERAQQATGRGKTVDHLTH